MSLADRVNFDPSDSPLRADSLAEALKRGQDNLKRSTDEFWSSPFGDGAAVPDGAQDIDYSDYNPVNAVNPFNGNDDGNGNPFGLPSAGEVVILLAGVALFFAAIGQTFDVNVGGGQ
jgi:hypothetical protein